MNIFNIIEDQGVLEKIFDNTASEINCDQWDKIDPENLIDYGGDIFLFYSKTADDQSGHLVLTNSNDETVKVTYFTKDGVLGYFKHNFDDKEFVGILNKNVNLGNEVGNYIAPITKKQWNELLKEYNIECVSAEKFKEIFGENKNLSLDKIYNQHLKYDDKVAVFSEDAVMFYDYNENPVFLLNQETVAKIGMGYNNLKEKDVKIHKITISQAIEAAENYSFDKITTKISYEDALAFNEIINNKIKEEIKKDEYYFSSLYEDDKISLFFQKYNIRTLSELSVEQNFNRESWKNKDIGDFVFFKNLHLLDLQRNSCSKYDIERPEDGWIMIKYKSYNSDYAIVPKKLAEQWLIENKQNVN